MPTRAIAWFRRDLRVRDNRMLAAATRDADLVWPVFVADPALLAEHERAPGRIAWFAASIRALDTELREAGSGLTVVAGEPARELRTLARRIGADAVYAGRDEDPAAVARDTAVAGALPLDLVEDGRIVPPEQVRTGDGGAYRVFSPFRRALERILDEAYDEHATEAVPAMASLAPRPPAGDGVDRFPSPDPGIELPRAGAAAAVEQLRGFLRSDLRAYADDRNRPDLDATSRISPYLRVGAISVRALWRAATNAAQRGRDDADVRMRRGADRWRAELAWREFFAGLIASEPRVATESFRPELDDLAWADAGQADEVRGAWEAGRTGFPFVDAGMRQLAESGWMHNRARLVTASFLVKDGGVGWGDGAAAFSRHLLDADVQQNVGNWQWVAGVGTDAAPYARIFNPVLQGRRFDPEGHYIRRWVPELADLPAEQIHEPWRLPAEARPAAYPAPILDHGAARRRALERYARVTGRR